MKANCLVAGLASDFNVPNNTKTVRNILKPVTVYIPHKFE
jgi:hypothetical protein